MNLKNVPRAVCISSLLFSCQACYAEIIVGSGDGYSLSVDDNDRFAILQIEQNEYDEWKNGKTSSESVTAMSNRVFKHFQDAYDFLLFISDEDDKADGAYFGRHFPVKNYTEGIGRRIFDATEDYGSAGRLQSAIHLTEMDGLLFGPSLHEFAHRWGNYLESVPTEVSGHWGFSGVGGQLGGWAPGTLKELGNDTYDADGVNGRSSFGTFANGGNGLPYSDFELYLMGLVAPEDVTFDVEIARDAEWVLPFRTSRFEYLRFFAAGLTSAPQPCLA